MRLRFPFVGGARRRRPNETADWTCMVCHDWRPDDKISVRTISTYIGPLSNIEMRQNIRYCNDRQRCIERAFAVTNISDLDRRTR